MCLCNFCIANAAQLNKRNQQKKSSRLLNVKKVRRHAIKSGDPGESRLRGAYFAVSLPEVDILTDLTCNE